jgi:Spy/CpxP family protein refolding chaperone
MVSTKLNSSIFRNLAARTIVAAALFAGQGLASPVLAAGRPFSSDRMVSHMTKRLNLDDAQAQKIKAILDGDQAPMKAQFQALRTARQALRQATMASSVNEGAIRNAAQALAQAEGDAALLRAQVHAQIVPILNAEQQQKFAAFGAERRGHWSHPAPPSE